MASYKFEKTARIHTIGFTQWRNKHMKLKLKSQFSLQTLLPKRYFTRCTSAKSGIMMCRTSETGLRSTSPAMRCCSRAQLEGADGLCISWHLVLGPGAGAAGPKSSLSCHLWEKPVDLAKFPQKWFRAPRMTGAPHPDFSLRRRLGQGVKLPRQQKLNHLLCPKVCVLAVAVSPERGLSL